MQSRESSPRDTEGDQDRSEKRGGDDDRIVDEGDDASRVMSRGGEDEITFGSQEVGQSSATKEIREAAGVTSDPPIGDIPSIPTSPVVPDQAPSTSSQIQVASVSGPALLEHLSLDDWKATLGFMRLRGTIENFLDKKNTSLEASLAVPLATAIEASYKILVPPPTYKIRYPEWTNGKHMQVLLGKEGKLESEPMCQVYKDRLKKEMFDMGKEAGLSDEEARQSSINSSSFGPCLPDMICQAISSEREVWTHVQEHKVLNQTDGLAQLLWYLIFANRTIGCYLGSLIVLNKLQRVVVHGTQVSIETLEEKATLKVIHDFESLFIRMDDCPMPFRLFDEVQTDNGRPSAEPNDNGLAAFLRITALASELAVQVGISSLERVPDPRPHIVAQESHKVSTDEGFTRLQDIAPKRDIYSRTADEISGAAGRTFPRDDARRYTPVSKKRKRPIDGASREDLNHHQDRPGKQVVKQPTQHTEQAAMASDHHVEAMSSALGRMPIPNVLSAWNLANYENWRLDQEYKEGLPEELRRKPFALTESTTSSINKVSAWRSAKHTQDSPHEQPCAQFRQQIPADHHVTETEETRHDRAAKEVRPCDSATFCSGSSWSTTWSDQFRDQKSITPSRVVGVLRNLGYGLSIISTASMDRLLPLHPASDDGYCGNR